MSRYVFKLPDLGEGTVEAEIVGCASSQATPWPRTTWSSR